MGGKIASIAVAAAGLSLFVFCASCLSMGKANERTVATEKETAAETVYETVDKQFFDLARYDNDRYMQYYWENTIVYNESAMVVKNADGSLDAIKLLYQPKQIISVRSADLTVKYEEGIDYRLSNGVLTVLTTGNIPIMPYEKMYFDTKPTVGAIGGTDGNGYFPTVDGKYEKYVEAGIFYDYQIAITYTHNGNDTYTVPQMQAEKVSGFLGKLQRGESVNIACLGDSISNGSNASGFFTDKLHPYMPTYFGLFGDYIKKKYNYQRIALYENAAHYVEDVENEPTRIKMTNFSVGGKDTYWGVSQIGAVSAVKPDLVILGFGMNDGSAYTSPAQYYKNMEQLIDGIRAENPNCEFVVIATMLPNENISWTEGGRSILGNQEKYLSELKTLVREKSGVALADVTTLHKEYLTVKNYRDMTGNNVNHPNDFLVRLYAQTVVKTIFG